MYTGDIKDSLGGGSGVGGFSRVSLSVISRRAATELQGKLIAMDTESIPAEKMLEFIFLPTSKTAKKIQRILHMLNI